MLNEALRMKQCEFLERSQRKALQRHAQHESEESATGISTHDCHEALPLIDRLYNVPWYVVGVFLFAAQAIQPILMIFFYVK